ncbi:nucleoside/nucleotide kinase family protein [Demequina zhanjiangensis]|uniref:Nucleoside/nucleotide kinase family protein n=1 Tax=Demequina zhanjiangensis TaxID=3051659 RepID=A0ABT8G616_9MICO|nr:nucleoside/nucleotide kinase family protein [Demequina sp. SYSU T00b26]MDN4474169.1 nucleoside/nucleotide kinase family protein [Demequina sp. SYSU T00b26]
MTASSIPPATADLAGALAAQLIEDLGSTPGTRTVGIAGGPGSGKSTLASALVGALRTRRRDLAPALVPMDGFHLRQAELVRRGLADRKGAPETFDPAGLAGVLDALRAPRRGPVAVPDYDRALHEPVPGRISVPSETRIVVVEGNWLCLDSSPWLKVRERLDSVWFLDVPWDVCRERLVRRRVATGREPGAARAWVDAVDAENYWLAHDSSRLADRILTPGNDRA